MVGVAVELAAPRSGGVRFDDAKCEERIAAMENIDVAADRTNLLYPARSRT